MYWGSEKGCKAVINDQFHDRFALDLTEDVLTDI